MKRVSVRRKGARHVCFVESDQLRDTEYEIAQLPDGNLACACMGYVFNTEIPKTCKHIAAHGASGGKGHYAYVLDKRTQQVETFTFKRGISFGAVPTGGQT